LAARFIGKRSLALAPTMQSRLKNFLYDSRERVLDLAESASFLNSALVVVLLILRYGFLLEDEQVDVIFGYLDILFLVYFLLYTTRLFYRYDWKRFIKGHWFESLLIAFIFFHGLVNLLGYNILYHVLEHLGSKFPVLDLHHILSIFAVILVFLDFARLASRLPDLGVKPAVTFLLSFVLLIGMGTGLLMLPAMSTKADSISFIDALFTSTSATCVTGLIVLDTANDFTLKGHLVIMFLIQIGGIGMATFATFFASFLTKGVGLKQQSMVQEFLGSEPLVSATVLLRRVVFITLLIEAIGAVFIFFSWEDEIMLGDDKFSSLSHKIFFSVFHAVSAFCNAGFSLFPGGLGPDSANEFHVERMYTLHFVIAIIIIFGSAGYTVILEVFSWSNFKKNFRKPWRNWSIGTAVSIRITAWLILIGWIGFMLLEFSALTDRTIIEALVTSLFQSVTTRTAGFNTMDWGALQNGTIILSLVLMFIGATPGSTGGGIKNTTFFCVIMAAIANIKRQERVQVAKRTIPEEIIRKSFSIFLIAVGYNILAIFLLSIFESPTEATSDRFMLRLIFEQVSAFGTAGLSMNFTGSLSDIGKCIIIVSMYLGRVGTLTLALALSDSVITNSYRYPDAHLMVG